LFVTTSELYINGESTLNEGHSEYDRTNYSIASSLARDAVGEFEGAKAALEDGDIAALGATRDRFLSLIEEKIAEAEELDADARQAEQETN